MPQSFFIFKGIDCRSMGVIMRGPASIIRPEERVKHVEIPGRSGDLTETEGENIFNSYIQTVSISVRGGFNVREIYKWLRGSGYVTFSGEPDRRQPARIIGAITLDKHSRNLDYWTGEVQFYCQPLKEKLQRETVTITSSGATVNNNGDVISRPMYRLIASGTTAVLTVTGTGTPSGNSITVTGLTSSQQIFIDSDTMGVWNSDGTIEMTNQSTGDFPVLAPGVNTITGSGWSSIEIDKKERFL
ncbi:MAG: phage tail family protein [Clostridia bacterium]|nr:phage tail family protein [Clostridia bacterium]